MSGPGTLHGMNEGADSLRGDVRVVVGGHLKGQPIRFHRDRPLGFAHLERSSSGAWEDYGGGLLAGFLRAAGAIQLSHRHPVAVASDRLDEAGARILACVQRSRNADPAWIEAPHARSLAGGDSVVVLMLTRRQARWLGASGAIERVEMPTGQRLDALLVGTDGEAELPPEYRQQLLDIPGLAIAPPLFQLGSGYKREAKLDNPYSCVLSPKHLELLGHGYCLIRNPYLEEAYPGLNTQIAALPEYDSVIPPERVLLDATLYVSVGLRSGELCLIEPLGKDPNRATRRVFRYRHAICRVGRTSAADMEKPLARLPQEVLEGMGVDGGADVVIESVAREGDVAELRKLKLRALPTRVEIPPLTQDAPDYFDETGSLDIPTIHLDLIRRRKLGVVQGSAVYVRPALSSVLLEELSSVLLLLAAGIVGGVATDTLWLSAALAVVYVVFVIWKTLRSFR